MVRVRVRVILDCEVTLVFVQWYGGIKNEHAGTSQHGLGPNIKEAMVMVYSML